MLKNELKTIAGMLSKATKYMNVEDTLIARKDEKLREKEKVQKTPNLTLERKPLSTRGREMRGRRDLYLGESSTSPH